MPSSSGITARSWNSSTANEAWPPGVCSRFFSASVASPIAVDDMATPMPATMPTASGCPRAAAMALTATMVAATCSAAQAKDRAAQRPHALRVELQADEEEQQHHAELGELQHRLRIRDQAQAPGADDHAGDQIAEHRAQAQATKQRHGDHAGREIHQRLLEKAVVFHG